MTKLFKIGGLALIIVMVTAIAFEWKSNRIPLYISFKPKSEFSQGITSLDYETIRDFEGCLLSGIATEEAILHGFRSSITSKVVYTNASYCFIKDINVLSGAYFSEQAEKNEEQKAVLNRSAAFSLFGGNEVQGETIEIENEKFLISGVIEDEQDEPAVYIPIALHKGFPQELIAKIEPENGVTQEYIRGLLRLYTDDLE